MDIKMKLIKHKNMRDVAFYPVRIDKYEPPNYMKVFGYWWTKQLQDLNGRSETIEIRNLSEWTKLEVLSNGSHN